MRFATRPRLQQSKISVSSSKSFNISSMQLWQQFVFSLSIGFLPQKEQRFLSGCLFVFFLLIFPPRFLFQNKLQKLVFINKITNHNKASRGLCHRAQHIPQIKLDVMQGIVRVDDDAPV
jgi:hypothetical protein